MEDFGRQMREMGNVQAQKMRDKARSAAVKRKEEYLGARVPKELREKVIARAGDLGIPVSILIRNILEQAFSDEKSLQRPDTFQSGQIASVPAERVDNFSSVIGWDQIELNRDMSCSSCGSLIAANSVATLGLVGLGEDRVILCSDCKKSV